MLETSARLLRLLSLLQVRREWPGASLAERLEVSARTLRRNVDRLRSLGYPVRATAGAGGGYRLEPGAAMPPLLLDDDETVAVAVGLHTAAGGSVTGIEESSLRALAKLEQIIPARLRRRVGALQTALVAVPHRGPTVDATHLAQIASACRDLERLSFAYHSHEGATTDRTVEPYRLVHAGGRWYLIAWDVKRADWRTFRLDRVDLRLPAGPRFARRPPPSDDIATYVSVGITSGVYRYRARVTIEASAATVADRIPPTAGLVEAIDETSCVLTAGSNDLNDLVAYIGLLGFDFQVHEPPELIAHLRDIAARLSRAADNPQNP